VTRRTPIADKAVREVFNSYPPKLRDRLLQLRELIFETAHKTQGVGALVETLKWGQPAYMPAQPRIGTTIRVDALKTEEPAYALFCHCQTPLIATFRDLYADRLVFQGNRAIVFSQSERVPRDALSHCIALALTYHLRSRQR
jgi:Domain of unknown function (DU1801)